MNAPNFLGTHFSGAAWRSKFATLWLSLGLVFLQGAFSDAAIAGRLSTNAQEPYPLQVQRLSDLDFGRTAKLGVRSGSVTIDAESGDITAEGGLVFLGGGAHRAKFEITGLPGSPVSIYLPSQLRIFSDQGNGTSVRVRKFRYEIENNGIIAADGKTIVWVGATLIVGRTTPPGHYRGFFQLQATY